MPGSPLDDLTLIALDDLVLHEHTQPARGARLRAEMARSGVLADPVVVTPTGSGRWLVLDGAHRTAALRELGLRSAVAQVMGLSPDGARLDSWSHDLPAESVPFGLGSPGPMGGPSLVATVERVDAAGRWGEPMAVTGPSELGARAMVTSAVARRYAERPYARTVPGSPIRPGSAARVTWTPWSAPDLVQLVETGITLPAGTTRFVLPGRVLGVRVSLATLVAEPSEVPVSLLADLRRQSVRTYTELVHVVEAGS